MTFSQFELFRPGRNELLYFFEMPKSYLLFLSKKFVFLQIMTAKVTVTISSQKHLIAETNTNFFAFSEDPLDRKHQPDKFEDSLRELMTLIKHEYSIDLPIGASKENVYTYEKIKYSWIAVDPLVSPLGGQKHLIIF